MRHATVRVWPHLTSWVTAEGRLRTRGDDHCPRGHPAPPGSRVTSFAWETRLRQHLVHCETCRADRGDEDAWWIALDPTSQVPPDRAPDTGMALVAHPPDAPAGPGRIELRLGGHAVADIDIALCSHDRLAVVEHVRTDPDYRRRGYARALTAAARTRAPGYHWSTTRIADDARDFWTAIAWPAPDDRGTPRRCPHLAAEHPSEKP